MNIAIVLAAGSSKRMGTNKLAIKIGGVSVLRKSLLAFDSCELIDKIIIVYGDLEFATESSRGLTKPIELIAGGEERQDSVGAGLSLVQEQDIVLIHDGARPFVSEDIILRCIASAQKTGSGVAGIPIYDSLKYVKDSKIVRTIERDGVFAMQTPQAFRAEIIKKAHQSGAIGTDDAALLESLNEEVSIVMGSKENIKLTTPSDIPKSGIRIGQGFDVHKLVVGEKLILCGEEIEFEKGLLGHSDADVAVHTIMDAILGALCEKDIGNHFPDTDPKYKGISSMELLKQVIKLMEERGFSIINCDLTIAAQRPKLAPYLDKMRSNLCGVLKTDFINVKATTTEKLGFVGREEGIQATAVVLLAGGNI